MWCDNAAGDRWHRCTDSNSASHFQCFSGSCFEHGLARGAGGSSGLCLRRRAESTVLDGADVASHPPQLPQHDARHQRVRPARCHVHYALCRPGLRVIPARPLMVRCWAIQTCYFSINRTVSPLNMICNPEGPQIADGELMYEIRICICKVMVWESFLSASRYFCQHPGIYQQMMRMTLTWSVALLCRDNTRCIKILLILAALFHVQDSILQPRLLIIRICR